MLSAQTQMRPFSKPVTTANAPFRNDEHVLVYFCCFPLSVGIELGFFGGFFIFFLISGFLSNLILNVFWKRASNKWERLFMCLQLSLHFTALQNEDLSSGHFAGSGALSLCLSFWQVSFRDTVQTTAPGCMHLAGDSTWSHKCLFNVPFFPFLPHLRWTLEASQYWQLCLVQVKMEQVAQGGDRCHIPGNIQGHFGWGSEKLDVVEGSLQDTWTRWPLKVPSNSNSN